MVIAGCFLLLAATAVAVLWPRGNGCDKAHLTAAAAPSCGVWWGSALNTTNSALISSVGSREASTDRRLDIVHTYHRWYDVFPTTAEQAVAHAGHLLFLNWEPTDPQGKLMSWSAIASGVHDKEIDAEASRLSKLGTTVLLSFSHEPELNYPQHGNTGDFVAAYRHVHDRMVADGATNVRWVWDLMGLDDPVWLARYANLYPGNAYVDWIAWDPYNWGACRSDPWETFAQVVTPFYTWLENHGYGDKPFMLGEWGTVEKPGVPSGKADWYAAVPDALTKLPNLRALVYFDLPAPPANCDWQITTSAPASAAYDQLARSSPFLATAKLSLPLPPSRSRN